MPCAYTALTTHDEVTEPLLTVLDLQTTLWTFPILVAILVVLVLHLLVGFSLLEITRRFRIKRLGSFPLHLGYHLVLELELFDLLTKLIDNLLRLSNLLLLLLSFGLILF